MGGLATEGADRGPIGLPLVCLSRCGRRYPAPERFTCRRGPISQSSSYTERGRIREVRLISDVSSWRRTTTSLGGARRPR